MLGLSRSDNTNYVSHCIPHVHADLMYCACTFNWNMYLYLISSVVYVSLHGKLTAKSKFRKKDGVNCALWIMSIHATFQTRRSRSQGLGQVKSWSDASDIGSFLRPRSPLFHCWADLGQSVNVVAIFGGKLQFFPTVWSIWNQICIRRWYRKKN